MTGAELRALRQAAGLTQRQAAERLQVNPLTIWRWENGKSPIPALKVAGIIAAMTAPSPLDKDAREG